MDGSTFIYELLPTVQDVRVAIANCEGKHVQQACYSTYMDTLTQICYTCQRIRGNHLWEGNHSRKVKS